MLFIPAYIEKQLKRARYEYDPEIKSWCAWIPQLPGVYAQAENVERLRELLAEVIEDYIFVKLKKGKHVPQFSWPRELKRTYA